MSAKGQGWERWLQQAGCPCLMTTFRNCENMLCWAMGPDSTVRLGRGSGVENSPLVRSLLGWEPRSHSGKAKHSHQSRRDSG